jgi:hypothetical protein
MYNLFTKHPKEVNETYLQHAFFAFACGLKLLGLGLVACTHAVLPFCFEKTVSQKLTLMVDCFKLRSLEIKD